MLNRNWIGVDNGNEAIKVILNRFQNGTQTLNEHISSKNVTKCEIPDLFSEKMQNCDFSDKVVRHLIDNYTIFANGNYSSVDFCLPHVLTTKYL